MKKEYYLVLGIILIGFLFTGILLYPEFMSDDAFIHIGFAKDIASGVGFSFAGNHTYGSTSPLWSILVALVSKSGLDLIISARALSALFSILSILLLFKVLKDKLSVSLALSFIFLFAFNSYFLRWAFTGMESTASCFFSLIMYIVFIREKENNSKACAYLLLGFAPLLRPEFYLFLFIFAIALFYLKKAKFPIYKFIVLAIPIVIWNVFAYFYFGSIIPTTFLAKANYSFPTFELENVVRTAKLILSGNGIEILSIIALVILYFIKRKVIKLNKDLKIEIALLIVLFCSFYFYYLAKNVIILSRYALILSPLILILLADILSILINKYSQNIVKINKTVFALILLSFAINMAFTFKYVKPDADRFVSGFQREYSKIAEIIKSRRESGASIAISDVGIVGAFSGAKIYDFCGLVDKDRFNFKNSREYFFNKKPNYFLTRGEISLSDLDSSNVSFNKIYETTIPNLGITKNEKYLVELYKVEWK